MSTQYPDLPDPVYLYDDDERCQQWWAMGYIVPEEWNGLHHQDMVYYCYVRQGPVGGKMFVTSDMGKTFMYAEQYYSAPAIQPCNICSDRRKVGLDIALWGWLDKELDKRKKE
jgi:hypothetical protein